MVRRARRELQRAVLFCKGRSAVFLLFLTLPAAIGGAGCDSGPDGLSPAEKEGYKLFRRYCTQCHDLMNPGLHTAEEWDPTVNRMQGYMRQRDKKVIDEQQKEKILAYLRSQARK